MKIEVTEGGHVYTYERREGDPYRWNVAVDGHPMPRMSEAFDSARLLWELALIVVPTDRELPDEEA